MPRTRQNAHTDVLSDLAKEYALTQIICLYEGILALWGRIRFIFLATFSDRDHEKSVFVDLCFQISFRQCFEQIVLEVLLGCLFAVR